MTQTLQQIFGPSATQTGTTITLNFNDFSTTGLDGTNPSAASILYALLKRLDTTLESAVDDPTCGVSASAFKPTKSFVTRGTQTQVQYPIQLNFYKADNATTLDPDDVI